MIQVFGRLRRLYLDHHARNGVTLVSADSSSAFIKGIASLLILGYDLFNYVEADLGKRLLQDGYDGLFVRRSPFELNLDRSLAVPEQPSHFYDDSC